MCIEQICLLFQKCTFITTGSVFFFHFGLSLEQLYAMEFIVFIFQLCLCLELLYAIEFIMVMLNII